MKAAIRVPKLILATACCSSLNTSSSISQIITPLNTSTNKLTKISANQFSPKPSPLISILIFLKAKIYQKLPNTKKYFYLHEMFSSDLYHKQITFSRYKFFSHFLCFVSKEAVASLLYIIPYKTAHVCGYFFIVRRFCSVLTQRLRCRIRPRSGLLYLWPGQSPW